MNICLAKKGTPRSFHALLRRHREAWALEHALDTLAWDAESTMAAAAASTRGDSMGVLRRIHHARLTGAEHGHALYKAAAELQNAGFANSVEGLLVERAREDYERERRVPPWLAAEIEGATQVGRAAWEIARSSGDWEQFAPQLERIIRLQRQLAERLGYSDHPYDALLQLYEPGLTTRALQLLLDGVREAVAPLIALLPRNGEPARRTARYSASRQLALARALVTTLGFDLTRGRVDATAHPNTMHLASTDVRLGVRIDTGTPVSCIRTTAHECGHGLYFQGLPVEFEKTPLWGVASAGMNEAQARLWEVLVVGSRPFADVFFPTVKHWLPKYAAGGPDDLYRDLNQPGRSARRLDADELTYMLHIVMRVEFEIDLIEGCFPAADLPSRWNARLEELIGVTATKPEDGPLQDVHWSIGLFGYFPSYAVGTLMACQLWHAARSDIAAPADMLEIQPETIRTWLAAKIYRHGRSRTGLELIESATGRPLDISAFASHIDAKFRPSTPTPETTIASER